jgi:hypothetical protein
MADPRTRTGADRELLRAKSEALRAMIENELLASYQRGFVNAAKRRSQAAANGKAGSKQPDDDAAR